MIVYGVGGAFSKAGDNIENISGLIHLFCGRLGSRCISKWLWFLVVRNFDSSLGAEIAHCYWRSCF